MDAKVETLDLDVCPTETERSVSVNRREILSSRDNIPTNVRCTDRRSFVANGEDVADDSRISFGRIISSYALENDREWHEVNRQRTERCIIIVRMDRHSEDERVSC